MCRRDLGSCLFAGGVALIALLSAGCAGVVQLPEQDIFSDPDARLLFEACERPTDTDSTLGLAGASSAERGRLALGAVVDLRPLGNNLYLAERKHKRKRRKELTTKETLDHLGCLLFGWYGNYDCLDELNDSTKFVEVTEFEFVPVIARPPIDSVLLADMQRFLEQERSGTDTAAHEQGRLLVDIWLIETQVTDEIGLIKNKIEGKVRIDVRVSDAATGETLWEHSFIGVGTEQGMFMGKRHYRRALSNAYCSALDMIKNALASPAIAPSTRNTHDSADSLP